MSKSVSSLHTGDAVNVNSNIDNILVYSPKAFYWSSAKTMGRTYTIGVSIDIYRLIKVL